MTNRRDLLPAAGVFLFALAWLLLLRPYGFQLEDEGTVLFWFERVLDGQRPYVDFHTGYTPGFFAFGHAAFALFGPTATALRGILAVVSALSAAGLTEVTRRVAGSFLAPLPALLWLAFVPVYVGEFAAFNVPYPTWPVTLVWMVLALAMLAWMESRRTPLLVLAGVAAATALALRPNSGAFALAAATWIVVAAAPRRTPLDRAAALAASAFMAAGVWYAFDFRLSGTDALVHLLPTFSLAALLTGPVAARLPAKKSAGAAASLSRLAAAFLLPTAAWALPLVLELGVPRFLYEVFLVGADYQTLYFEAHPAPEPWAVFVVAAMLALAAGGFVVSRTRIRPLVLVAVTALVGGLAKVFLLREGLAPEGLVRSLLAQYENASFWLAATASFGAVAWLARVPAATLRRSSSARAFVVVAPLAAAMYLQMFPRSDFMHQVTSVPLTAALACALLGAVESWWSRGAWPSRWDGRRTVRVVIAAAALSALGPAFVEKAAGPLSALAESAPRTALPARLDVRVEAAAGDELEAVARTVEYLETHADPGESCWSFPATSGLLFAAGLRNALPHDYWYPGRPDRTEEERVLGVLREAKPRFLVTLNRGWNFFAEAPVYFHGLRRLAAAEYRLAARFGRYDVLVRRGVPGAGPAISWSPSRKTTAEDVALPNLERRRQAAARWMETITAEEAAAAALPADRRRAILLLRALRDGGDLRGAGWVLLGLRAADPRVRTEALDASGALLRALEAARAAGRRSRRRPRSRLRCALGRGGVVAAPGSGDGRVCRDRPRRCRGQVAAEALKVGIDAAPAARIVPPSPLRGRTARLRRCVSAHRRRRRALRRSRRSLPAGRS
jgi:hypothetical protein